MPGIHAPLAPTTVRPDLGPFPRALTDLIEGLSEAVDRCIEHVMTWQQRAAERALLAELTDRDLRDIGLTRSDALVEANKAFWRA